MLKQNYKSLLDAVIDNDKEDFKDSVNSSFNDANDTDPFYKGNVLLSVPWSIKSVQNAIDINMSTCISLDTLETKGYELDIEEYDDDDNRVYYEGLHKLNAEDLSREVSSKILNLNINGTFEECLAAIVKYKTLAKNHFYGALLRDPNDLSMVINPLHILTALSILEDENSVRKNKYNVILYFYNNRDASDRIHNTTIADESMINENIDNLMHMYVAKTKQSKEILKETYDSESSSMHIEYITKVGKNDSLDFKLYLVANQILTNTIMVPYYGASLIRTSNRSVNDVNGINVTPFGHINISNEPYLSTECETQWSAICTGRYLKYTVSGIRTLTHGNILSPYTNNPILPGALRYADIMMDRTIELYKNANLLGDTDV